MLYDYLITHYLPAEPIFFSDIMLEGISKPMLSLQLKELCEAGNIKKMDTGVYFIPKKNRLHISIGPDPDTVASYRFISRRGKVEGYYSGNTFANQIGLITQVPRIMEITSNNTSVRFREIEIAGRKYLLRKPYAKVTNENARVLQLLDLIKDFDKFTEGNFTENQILLKKYIIQQNITKPMIDEYIRLYPDRVFRNYYEQELDDVFTSQ